MTYSHPGPPDEKDRRAQMFLMGEIYRVETIVREQRPLGESAKMMLHTNLLPLFMRKARVYYIRCDYLGMVNMYHTLRTFREAGDEE